MLALPTAQEIVDVLPGGIEVTPLPIAQGYIDEAVGHLREASGTADDAWPPRTATAREFVREYASGHALKKALQGGSGVVDADEIAKLLDRADKLLARYDAAHTSPIERPDTEVPDGYTGLMYW